MMPLSHLRRMIIVNRVCRRIQARRRLMDHTLRRKLASRGADKEDVIVAVSERLMTADNVRSQVTEAWAEAEADVNGKSGAELLAIAPGEEILDEVFRRYADRHYRKREDGPAIAKASEPPAEIEDRLAKFLSD